MAGRSRAKRRRRRAWNAPRRHPWPPELYECDEMMRFFDRENARLRAGKITHEQWVRLPWERRRTIENPELRYWRRRLDNENRRDARRANRHLRREREAAGDRREAAAYYREVKRTPLIDCPYCGLRVAGKRAHIDHVVPLARGGLHVRSNLVACCEGCNRRKRALTGDEFRALLAAESASRSTQEVRKTKSPCTRAHTGKGKTAMNERVTSMGLGRVELPTSRLSGPPDEIGAAALHSDSPLGAASRTERDAPRIPVETTSGRTQDVHTIDSARKSDGGSVVLDRRGYRAQILIAYAAARAVRDLPVDALLTAIEHAHAAGPFVDPTLYRERVQAMNEDEAMLRVLADAKRALEALPWPAPRPSEFIAPPAAEPFDELDATRIAFGSRP